MTDEKIDVKTQEVPNDIRELLEYIRQHLIRIVTNLIELSGSTIIEYIVKQINLIIDRVLNYINIIQNQIGV